MTARIVQCNRTLAAATGYSREELIGRSVLNLCDPGCLEEARKALKLVRQAGRVSDVELLLRCKDGSTLDVSSNVSAVRDETGTLYHRLTWRDISKRKRAEAALRAQERALQRSQLELRALAAKLLTAQEEEQRRISRDLHDDMNQRVALLTLEIETLCGRLPRSRVVIAERLHLLRDRVVELSDEIHRLAYQLHPAILDDLGLAAALQSYAADFTPREGVHVTLDQQNLPRPIPRSIASCLYRVVQEALRNVAKHARATHVTVTLEKLENGISLLITDSGVGFDPSLVEERRSGLGVVSMEERVRLVDGRFTLESRPGEGTRVRVWVPLPEDVA